MSDAKLQNVLSSLSQTARQLNAPPAGRTAPDATYVKLDTNENPFPLPTIVWQSAITALERQYLYPEDDNLSLREAAANAYGVATDHVIAGNGSSEILGLIYRAFLAPGRERGNAVSRFFIQSQTCYVARGSTSRSQM